MGTKGSYTGEGGAAGNALRQTIDDWLDSLPPPADQPNGPDNRPPIPQLRPETLLPVIGMFRPAAGHADGPSGGGGSAGSGAPRAGRNGGGAQRTTTRSANTAGRAAAAAFGLRTGNAAVLRELGLDYESLRTNPDPIDVTRQIVAAACGPLPDGTIEDEEQRVVAAMVTEWVLESNADGGPPSPEEVVREAIAQIIFEAASSEIAAQLRKGGRPEWASEEAEGQLLEIAHSLAHRAPLSATGPTAKEFSQAIENGIDAMRLIQGAS